MNQGGRCGGRPTMRHGVRSRKRSRSRFSCVSALARAVEALSSSSFDRLRLRDTCAASLPSSKARCPSVTPSTARWRGCSQASCREKPCGAMAKHQVHCYPPVSSPLDGCGLPLCRDGCCEPISESVGSSAWWRLHEVLWRSIVELLTVTFASCELLHGNAYKKSKHASWLPPLPAPV